MILIFDFLTQEASKKNWLHKRLRGGGESDPQFYLRHNLSDRHEIWCIYNKLHL